MISIISAPLIDPWYDTHAHFQKFPVITLHRRRAVCGLPFTGTIQMYLGLRWLLRFQTFSSAKILHSSCLFFSSLDRVLLWVGRGQGVVRYGFYGGTTAG